MKKSLFFILFVYSSIVCAATKPPKLIVQIVVDQLRGDLINQYRQEFGPNGFNYLLAHSINYANTHHPHANTITCVGHATISTGAYPSLHGIVSNDWYDRKTKQIRYCTDDPNSPIVPTSRSKNVSPGRSPRNILSSTLSDELVLAQTGRAFAVSLKDRSAITLAGHAGKAFWFDKVNGGFVSSTYYYSAYPQWVNEWNKRYENREETWTLGREQANYRYAKAPRFNNRYPNFGDNFPHRSGNPQSAEYYKFISMTPFSDELTADFAINLLTEEKLGSSKQGTDYLGISFSAVDAIGHQFGPNSLESEDNLLRLDKTLTKLLAVIEQQVGLENTLIVLTADHGVSDSGVYLSAHHIEETGALKLSELKEIIEHALAKRFKLPASSLEAIVLPYVYLNHQIIEDRHFALSEVSAFLAEVLRQQPGIFQCFSLPLINIPPDWLSTKVNRMAYLERSGDLYLIPPAFQALGDKSEQRVAHGTPWRYDSYVPLLFANPTFKAQQITRPTRTTDIAATLAALLEIKQPSATVGSPLAEVLQQFENKELKS